MVGLAKPAANIDLNSWQSVSIARCVGWDEIEGGCLHKETQWGVIAFGSILLSDYLGCRGKDNNYYVLHILKLHL